MLSFVLLWHVYPNFPNINLFSSSYSASFYTLVPWYPVAYAIRKADFQHAKQENSRYDKSVRK